MSVLSAPTHQAHWFADNEQDTLSLHGLTKRAFITPKNVFIQPVDQKRAVGDGSGVTV